MTATSAPARAPRNAPPPLWDRLAVPTSPRLPLLAAGVGLVGDLAVRSGGTSLAAALLVLAAAGAIAASGRVVNRAAYLPLAAAPVFGLVLAVRTSAWVTFPSACAALGLLGLGASLARSGSPARLPARDLGRRALRAVVHWLLAPGLLKVLPSGTGSRTARRALPVARGLLVAAPIVLLLGALLMSADAVFASLFATDVKLDVAAGHLWWVAVAGWAMLGLLRTASTDDGPPPPAPVPTAPRTEATIVLGSVVVLFGAFVATQVVTAAVGADHVLATAGLTRAEYARSGFFQLLWVAGLTIAGLGVTSSVCDLDGPGGRRLRRLVAAVVALALAIVAVAVVRLDLYRDAYGWTMLRLACTVVACWLGAVLVLAGLSMAGPVGLRGRGWAVPASIAVGLGALLAFAATNPEDVVARSNLAQASVPLDVEYLATGLGADALPALVDGMARLDDVAQGRLRLVHCAGGHHVGWAAWNLSTARAGDARLALCGFSPPAPAG